MSFLPPFARMRQLQKQVRRRPSHVRVEPVKGPGNVDEAIRVAQKMSETSTEEEASTEDVMTSPHFDISMLKADLEAIAQAEGVEIPPRATKADIIAILEANIEENS